MIQIDHKGGYLIQFTIKLDTKVKIFEKSDTKDDPSHGLGKWHAQVGISLRFGFLRLQKSRVSYT